MRWLKKMTAAVLTVAVTVMTMVCVPTISAKADGENPTNRELVANALTHLGAGYSQGSDRWGTDKYDCSAFVWQMLRSVGFFGTIPSTTASWRSYLSGKQVGDTFQMYCSRNGVQTLQTFVITAAGDSCMDVNPISYPEGTIVLQNGHIFISLGDYSRFMTEDAVQTEANVRNYLIGRYPEVDANLFYGINPYFGNSNVYCQASEKVWKIDAGTYTGVSVRNKTVVADGTQTVYYAFRLVDGQDIYYTDSQVTSVDENGYTITAKVSSAAQLLRAEAYTWTEAGGPENAIRQDVVLDGSDTVTYQLNIADMENQHGVYYTNLYIYDVNGSRARTKQAVTVPYPQPTIQRTWITDLDTTGYTVFVEFDNAEYVDKVQIPTWTEYNGQDDLIWHDAKVDGNVAYYHVNINEHGSEGGVYNSHVYVTCVDGNSSVETLRVEVPLSVVQKSGVTERTIPNIEHDEEMLQAIVGEATLQVNRQSTISNGNNK